MDPSILLTLAAQWGIAGLVLLGCCYYILYKDKEASRALNLVLDRHDSERKEWLILIDRQHHECLSARAEATRALIENTVALTRICSLIEDRK